MAESLKAFWVRILGRWQAFSPNQKRNLMIALAAILAALVSFLWILLRPNYVVIMTGLDDKSLGQVQTQLQTLKIPDQIQGSEILVPSSQASAARVDLAMAGLPDSGTISYSSINNSFGMTQDQFNIQVLNVLQQSLAQTIQSMNGVESAQVHIVMPQQQVFINQPQSSAKASVFVQLGSGVQLSAAQVAGIQQLVAHSVTGLTADNVTVTDQNGVTLSAVPNPSGSLSDGVSGTASEIALRQQLEQSMTEQLTQGLDQIVGTGNAVVMVQANVTFNKVQSSAHILQAQPGSTTGLPTSTQTIRDSSSGSTTTAGGAAGQSSSNPNLPSYAGQAGNLGNSTTSHTELTTNYANSYVNTTTVNDPLQMKGYSVGVFLNANDKALTPAVVNQIKSFVSNAIGQTGNGVMNSVSVSTMPFQQTPAFSLQGKPNYLMYGGIGALALMLLGGGAVLLKRRRAKDISIASTMSEEIPLASLETLPLTDDEKTRDQLLKLANNKPDEFANLLRSWLTE